MGARKLNNKLNIVSSNLYKYRTMRKMSQPDICRELALMGVTLYINDIYKIEHMFSFIFDNKKIQDFSWIW